MPVFDINQYITETGRAGAVKPQGSVQQQISAQEASLGVQAENDAQVAAELARRQVKAGEVKGQFDLALAVQQTQITETFATQLKDLGEAANRNQLEQTSAADELEGIATKIADIKESNVGVYNPLKLLRNGLELNGLQMQEQALLKKSIALSNIQKMRAGTLAQTFSAYDASVVVPEVNRLREDAIRTFAEMNIEGVTDAVETVRKSLGQTNSIRQQGINNTLAKNAEQRAAEDQALQRKAFALQEQTQKVNLEKAKLDLAEARAGSVNNMAPAIDTYLQAVGLESTPENRNLGAAYIKNVAAKDPQLYAAYSSLGVSLRKSSESGKPMNRRELLQVVNQMPVKFASQILEQAGETGAIDAIESAFFTRQAGLSSAVTKQYRVDNGIPDVKPLTAAQQKQVDLTVNRQLERLTPFDLMKDSAAKFKKANPPDISALAEGKTLYAVTQSPLFRAKLTANQQAVVATSAFKNAVEAPVVAEGSKAVAYKAFDMMQAAVNSKTMTLPEAADLTAKMIRDNAVISMVKSSSAAEGLVRNGFDISPDNLTVSLNRKAATEGRLVSMFKNNSFNLFFGTGITVSQGGQQVLSSMQGDVNVVDPAALMLYYNKRLKDAGRN